MQTFIDDFYRDNASRVLRKDITMYTIVAYAAIFRIDELGVHRFRELLSTQEPSKMSVFINYVFNEENLWNTLRSSWMTVKDLDHVEKQIIPRVSKFISPMSKFSNDLVQNALDNAAAEQAKKDAAAKGEVGVTKVARRPPTVPTSPRLTQTRPPLLPEPQRIVSQVVAKDVPGFLNNTTLSKLERETQERMEAVKAATLDKYNPKAQFRFHKTKGVRPIEEVRQEIEAAREQELQFNSSFHHPPPDFSRAPSIRLTAAAILREDSLYRKKQAEDAETLRRYEEELRDPTEYYRWQADLRERDHIEKLKHVSMRRTQAKDSAEEAKFALVRQREDNAKVADLVRRQGEAIKTQKELEKEIEVLQKQNVAQAIAVVRDSKPLEAVQSVLKEREERGKVVREELERLRIDKEEQDRREEEVQMDKIRQLRAFNIVHKPIVKVFDPTEASGVVLLDSMSYLEMKERQKVAARKQKESEEMKREEIHQHKEKLQVDLSARTQSILRARQLKAEANQQMRQAEKERKLQEERLQKAAEEAAQAAWQQEVQRRREKMAKEKEALLAEQERIKRQQQYLGAAHGQVAEMRERQVLLAQARQQRKMVQEQEGEQRLAQQTQVKEKVNKTVVVRQDRRARLTAEEERERSLAFEKNARTEKLKEDVLYRKQMFALGQDQHGATRNVLHETNPYATQITQRVHTEALRHSARLASTSR